ncbi:hypothetical protein BDA96_01G477900 [Sorghum bicolor]|uniref:F-box domain-containing protein n=2 Tax=Sorghum bicolor TaxID=4558 RepID=A0A921S695_SORBI|nr:hypothetical protein BDA96_01G477900 [Sorghum bicolor]OQU92968.1 hypothetical protein SORBI_3001G448900 [Sorghum bicolor]
MELVELLEELVEEILLRIPPDEPAYLIRATLVCKSWLRILSDRDFLGRYRAFHRTPPLLGYFHNLYSRPGQIPRFVRTTSAASLFPEQVLGSSCWWALDCRHGRVLTRTYEPADRLVVFDPVTGDQHHLSVPTYPDNHLYTGAVLCAAMDASCDHLNCHGGPFIVVFVGVSIDDDIRASVYSSETQTWGASTSLHPNRHHSIVDSRQSLLVGGMLYFTLSHGKSILRYEFGAHRLSVIDVDTCLSVIDVDTCLSVIDTPGVLLDNMVIAKADDGGLGLITVWNNRVYFWMQQQAGTNDSDDSPRRWVRHRVTEQINTLPPQHYRSYYPCSREVIGFAEDNDIIFINRDERVFMLDIKSMHVRKIGERQPYRTILPYVSFYTAGTFSLCLLFL